MEKKLPLSVEELKQLRKPIRNIVREQREHFTALERIALWVTRHVGTVGFFIVILLWTLVWLGWNTLGPIESRFDPYPAFVLWLFISNMIQLFLLPMIMVGQNLESRYSEARAEADFEVNMKAEREIETILLHLERQNERIEEIVEKLNRH